MTAAPRPQLPALLRVGTVVALALGAMVSWVSAAQIGLALGLSESESRDRMASVPSWVPDPRALGEAQTAGAAAEASALESMRGSRLLILLVLWGAASLMFVAALRLRWPAGAPRPAMARLLGTSAIVAAVVRTADGAQHLVVMRRAGAAMDKALAASEILSPYLLKDTYLLTLSALSVGVTLGMTGVLLAVGTYFRSMQVAEVLAEDDARLAGGGEG